MSLTDRETLPFRIAALCAALLGSGLIFLLTRFAGVFVFALIFIGILGGYAAAHLGRGGWRWSLGAVLFGLPFFVLALLPRGTRNPKLSRRIPSVVMIPVSALLVVAFARYALTEPAHWDDATHDDNIKGYEQYLSAMPAGAHAAAARNNIAEQRARKARVQPWLDSVLKSASNNVPFSADSVTNDRFLPPFFPVYSGKEKREDLEHYVRLTLRHFLTDDLARARTLLFVRTRMSAVGQYERPGGAKAGVASEQYLTIEMFDADHLNRRRVIHATSYPAERIKGNDHYGGSHVIDGVRSEGDMYVGELYAEIIEKLVKQNP